MQKTLKSRKLLAMLLALMMVLAILPMSAMAAGTGDYLAGNAIPPNPANPDSSTYEMSVPASADSITVTLVIEAGDVIDLDWWEVVPDTSFRLEIPVTLGDGITSNTYTVTDLLAEVDGTYDLTFYGKQGNSYIPFTDTTTYLAAVEYDGDTWYDSTYVFGGWAMRVNDQFPVEPTADTLGYQGTGIIDTYIDDGDIIHFFFDYPTQFSPSDPNYAANFVRGIYEGHTATNLSVQLQGHKTFIDQSTMDYIMSVYNYVDLGAGVTAYLYSTAGAMLDTAVSDGYGVVEFDGVFDDDEVYIVKTAPTYNFATGWDEMLDGALFINTGAYSKIKT